MDSIYLFGEYATEEAKKAIELIHFNMLKNDQVVSGKTYQDTVSEVISTKLFTRILIIAPSHIENLQTGVPKWQNKAAAQDKRKVQIFGFILKRWAQTKGIDINPFVAARKIALYGSALFRSGEKKDIYDTAIETLQTNINTYLSNVLIVNLERDVTTMLNKFI